jgi:hypothetical protein
VSLFFRVSVTIELLLHPRFAKNQDESPCSKEALVKRPLNFKMTGFSEVNQSFYQPLGFLSNALDAPSDNSWFHAVDMKIL